MIFSAQKNVSSCAQVTFLVNDSRCTEIPSKSAHPTFLMVKSNHVMKICKFPLLVFCLDKDSSYNTICTFPTKTRIQIWQMVLQRWILFLQQLYVTVLQDRNKWKEKITSLAIIAASLLSTSDINLVDNAKHVLILNSIPTAKKICGLTLFLRSQFHLYCCKYP